MAANIFNSVQLKKPTANWFDLGHDLKYSTQMGRLTPIFCEEVLPGDVWRMKQETLIRFAPLVSPVMHDIAVYHHYFFVPDRLLWDNWEKFITGANGVEADVPAAPYFMEDDVANQIPVGSLMDFLGYPTETPIVGTRMSALPVAAYKCIYNEYYRDQNLIDEVPYKLQDGRNFGDVFTPEWYYRAWQHDYFTSALPWAQKGGAVTIPIGNFEDVGIEYSNNVVGMGFRKIGGGDFGTATGAIVGSRDNAPNQDLATPRYGSGTGDPVYYDPGNSLVAKTSELEVGAATINDLRKAFRLQEWLEKMARGGSRYIEQNLVHFGVRSSDQRLQRPEFLGGTRQPVIISEVLQTSSSDETSPQATMAGHAISASGGSPINYRAEEHGFIMVIQSVMPKTAYQQGLHRKFTRFNYLDYAWPTFAHIGEQEVLNKEVYANSSDNRDEEVFGYVPRYAEYRFANSRVAGDFKTSLSFWHMGRIFGSRPTLSKEFIEAVPGGSGSIREDIFAVQNTPENPVDHLWCHTTHRVKTFRKLPKYGTPTL